MPGEVAAVIAAMPPLIRFTNPGIRMVDHEMVEADWMTQNKTQFDQWVPVASQAKRLRDSLRADGCRSGVSGCYWTVGSFTHRNPAYTYW